MQVESSGTNGRGLFLIRIISIHLAAVLFYLFVWGGGFLDHETASIKSPPTLNYQPKLHALLFFRKWLKITIRWLLVLILGNLIDLMTDQTLILCSALGRIFACRFFPMHLSHEKSAPRTLSIESWLFNRDPYNIYNGLL